MNKAYVLVNSVIGLEEVAFDKLKQLSRVKEIYKVYGAYDIALRVEEKNHFVLKDVITNTIRKIEGVSSTLTMVLS